MYSSRFTEHLRNLRVVSPLARAQEWWEYKLTPVLATAYATALLLHIPLLSLPLPLGGLLLALSIGAAYVSIINDYTDRAEDLAAGKHNRLASKSPAFVGVVLGACLVAGIVAGWWLGRLHPLGTFFYLGAWVAYSLYSFPPFRWKTRGLLGLLADALGAHVFPQLLAVVTVSGWSGQPIPAAWLGLVGSWAFACGLRNILWHQLHDADNDYQTKTTTFVYQYGALAARRLAEWALFPLEVALLFALLYLLARFSPVAGLTIYLATVWLRYRLWAVVPVIVRPQGRYHLLLNEYYETLYPVTLLLAACAQRPLNALMLLGHLLLFPRHSWQVAQVWYAASRAVAGRIFRRARLRFRGGR